MLRRSGGIAPRSQLHFNRWHAVGLPVWGRPSEGVPHPSAARFQVAAKITTNRYGSGQKDHGEVQCVGEKKILAERTVSRSRTSKIATSNAAEMASRGTLPEGSKKPPRKESRRPSGMGRWARVYTRKLSVISNQLPENDGLGGVETLPRSLHCGLAERRQRCDRDDSKGKDNSKKKTMGGV